MDADQIIQNDLQEILASSVPQSVERDESASVKAKDEISSIEDANDKILYGKLLPSYVDDEKQKRGYKTMLLVFVGGLIVVQTLGCLFVIGFSLIVHGDDIEVLKLVTDFTKYFLNIFGAEFVAMFFFIVKYVFDKSVITLIHDFKSKK